MYSDATQTSYEKALVQLYDLTKKSFNSWFNRGKSLLFKLGVLSCYFFTASAFAQYYSSNRYNSRKVELLLELAGMKLLIILVALGVGFFLGFLMSPRAKGYRLIIGLVALASLFIFALYDTGVWGWSATYISSIVALMTGIGFGIGKIIESLAKKPTTFGSAEWATREEIEKKDLFMSSGFKLGKFAAEKVVYDAKREGGIARKRSVLEHYNLNYSGDRHLLTVAPTRSGKGTSAIIPNLLTYKGSAFVIDPKGENALITAKRREELKQEVYVLDPWGIAEGSGYKTAHFNPLDWLDPDDPDMAENAMILADSLIVMEGSKEKFWDEEAKALLQGLILYVATDETEQDTRHLGRVRDLMLLDEEDSKELFQQMHLSEHHIVSSTGVRCLQKDEKLLSNVMTSLQAQTHMLDSPRLREVLSRSDFKFEDLKIKKMTVFLVLPSDRLSTFNRWLRLMVQQAITVNARNINKKPEKPILFLLDEMPALGRLAMVEQAYGLMAGFGMQLWGIVQDLSQLKKVYGEGWETFISNSGVLQYFGSRDKMTAEYFSSLCGVTTVWNISSAIANAFSSTTGGQSNSTSNSNTRTQTTSATQRKLVFPDELMRLKEGQQLLLVEDINPIWGEKTPWFKEPTLENLGVNLHTPNGVKAEIKSQKQNPKQDDKLEEKEVAFNK